MADQDTQQQLARLQKAREKVDEFSRENSRITGEMGAIQGQIKEQEIKCQEDFQCGISEMPVFIKQLKESSERALFNAEVILGIRDGILIEEPVHTPVHTHVKESVPVVTRQDNKAIAKQTEIIDEDALL